MPGDELRVVSWSCSETRRGCSELTPIGYLKLWTAMLERTRWRAWGMKAWFWIKSVWTWNRIGARRNFFDLWNCSEVFIFPVFTSYWNLSFLWLEHYTWKISSLETSAQMIPSQAAPEVLLEGNLCFSLSFTYATPDWMPSQDILLTGTFGAHFSHFSQAGFPPNLVEPKEEFESPELKHVPSRVGGVRSWSLVTVQ